MVEKTATDDVFAEIECDYQAEPKAEGVLAAKPKADASFDYTPILRRPYATTSVRIAEREHDPIRDMFYGMRSLARGNPFAKVDSKVFYKQAKYMEYFTDDFDGEEGLSVHYPCYQHMGYKQLRTYFTWRASVRRGVFRPTSLSYVFLYIYELLSNIGVSGPADGFCKLVELWTTFRGEYPELGEYLPDWLRDYHVYYGIPSDYASFAAKYDLDKPRTPDFLVTATTGQGDASDAKHDIARDIVSLFFDPKHGFTRYPINAVSSYDITKSSFYKDGNAAMVRDCLSTVLEEITGLFARGGSGFKELLVYTQRITATWYPFRRAVFYDWRWQSDRSVEMPGGEVYRLTDNRWTVESDIVYPYNRELVGYMLMKTEECLREAVKYKRKLAIDAGLPDRVFGGSEKMTVSRKAFDDTVAKAVARFHWDATRTVVTVDTANLERIRSEAQKTQDRLTVPEEI